MGVEFYEYFGQQPTTISYLPLGTLYTSIQEHDITNGFVFGIEGCDDVFFGKGILITDQKDPEVDQILAEYSIRFGIKIEA